MVATSPASATETAFSGEIEIRCPFSAAFVDALKEAIPARHRRWDPDDVVWCITGPHVGSAVDLLLAHFPAANVPDAYASRVPATVTSRPIPPVPPVPREQMPPAKTGATLAPREADASLVVAHISCPRCHAPFEQLLRVTAASSTHAVQRPITPELLAICPSCQTLAVVSVVPAAVAEAVLS